MLDTLLATTEEKREAARRAEIAVSAYGPDALTYLEEQLRHPKRNRSKRVLRLAIRKLSDEHP